MSEGPRVLKIQEFGHYDHNIKASLKGLTYFFKANAYFLEIRR